MYYAPRELIMRPIGESNSLVFEHNFIWNHNISPWDVWEGSECSNIISGANA